MGADISVPPRPGSARAPLVLVVDDDRAVRSYICELLTDAGFDIAAAADGAAALRIADALPIDVVLLDHRLPDMTGHDVLTMFRTDPHMEAVPVLIVTADETPSVITRGLELGANDFVLKPFEPVELIARIELARRIKAERDSLLVRNEQLERSASLDELTGIPNRAHFDKQLVSLASLARRRRTPLAILAIDVDRFKDINDQHGHPAGDTVLRALAEALQNSVRAEDVVGRVGGEEFRVLLPDTDLDGGRELGERIRRRMHAISIDGPRGPIRVTVSIGCAAGVTVDPDELVRSADAALYLAKASGRDRVVPASSHLRDKQGAITVLIVDDHRMVAESMARLIERENDLLVAGVVTTAQSALDVVRQAPPDVVLLDFHLPDGDGVSTSRALRELAPELRILLVTGEGGDAVRINAVDAGCAGYLDKTRAADELVAAIRAAYAGEIVMAPADLKRVVRQLPAPSTPLRDVFLSETEQRVLSLAAEGLDNRQIADHLGLRVSEVVRNVQSLLARLDAHSKLEAIASAHRHGLIDLTGEQVAKR